MCVGGGAKPPGAPEFPQEGCNPYWLGGAPSASPKRECVRVCSRWWALSEAETSPWGIRRPKTSVKQSCEEQLQEARVLPFRRASRWASVWSFPGPISGCLPTPTLSLAWPSLGESRLLFSLVLSPHSSARTPSLVRRSEALFLGARPGCLGGPREGAQVPEPSLTSPNTHGALGGWEVGGGRLAREGKS